MAAWFRFDKDFDDRPAGRGLVHAYKAGNTLFITEPAALRAEAAGIGERTEKPRGAKTTKAGKTIQRDVEFKG